MQATISGVVLLDRNYDSLVDPSDWTLAGVELSLLQVTATNETAPLGNVTTGGDGRFSFSVVPQQGVEFFVQVTPSVPVQHSVANPVCLMAPVPYR